MLECQKYLEVTFLNFYRIQDTFENSLSNVETDRKWKPEVGRKSTGREIDY